MTENFRNNQQNSAQKSPKRFNSLHEFKMLEEFPETKSMAIIDSSGDIIFVNHSFANIFGLSENQNIVLINSDPNLFSLIQGLEKSRYSSFHSELFLNPDGGSLPSFFTVEVERIYIADSEYFVFILSSQDSTRNIEDKINNLHNALEFGNVPVITTDAAGRIKYSTKSFEEILGRNIEYLYNQPLTDIIAPLLSRNDLADASEAIDSRNTCLKVISGLNSDGKLVYRELKITPVRAGYSEASEFIVTANDITDYILRNRVIKRSEERQKSIINNISDLLLIVRQQNRTAVFENANDNFYSTFLLKRDEVTEKPIADILPGRFYSILTNLFESLQISGNTYKEFRYREMNTERDYLGSVTFTDDNFEDQRIFIVCLKDITEQLLNEDRLRRAYEKETHINKLKSSFLANMSHEIRTPLNAIVGYSELIEDDVRSGDISTTAELFPFLKDGFNRLLALMDNILEVSLIQSGETEFEIELTDASSVLLQVCGNFANFAQQKSIKFAAEAGTAIFIEADKSKLEKILSMLVDNAIKYNEYGGSVRLSCSTENGFVKIAVSDTGRGIKQENLNRMLEPFSQEDEGHKRKYEGAGLGLTIAYNLTRLMGGEFIVNSIPDKGTAISLIFPESGRRHPQVV